jgi:hypothetical protein
MAPFAFASAKLRQIFDFAKYFRIDFLTKCSFVIEHIVYATRHSHGYVNKRTRIYHLLSDVCKKFK